MGQDRVSQPVIGLCAVRERARWSFWDQEAHLVADTSGFPHSESDDSVAG